MASLGMKLSFFMAMLTMLWMGVNAQSGCTTVLISLSPCLNYITGNSTTPSSSCCTQLATVVRSSPQCLCEVLSEGGSSLGISINRTQALTLPAACNVETPPVSQCDAIAPVGSPTGSAESPTKSREPGNGPSSGGSYIQVPISLLSVLLLVASQFTTFSGF